MSSRELIDTALRVLAAIDHGRQPDEADLQILKSHAGPDETALSMDQFAGEIIKREIAKRRALRAKN
jgi:hypothetical protein